MRDRFIVGAGNSYAVGTTGGISSQTTTTASAGLHTHAGTTGAYALTINDIPSHTHSASAAVSDPSHVHNLGGGVMVNPGISASTGFSFPNINIGPGWDVGGTVSNAAYTGIGVVISVGNEGGSASHSHTINADGVHTHTVTAWDNRPPYLALAYIQRIS
jgi:microcystin-dependent protein